MAGLCGTISMADASEDGRRAMWGDAQLLSDESAFRAGGLADGALGRI